MKRFTAEQLAALKALTDQLLHQHGDGMTKTERRNLGEAYWWVVDHHNFRLAMVSMVASGAVTADEVRGLFALIFPDVESN